MRTAMANEKCSNCGCEIGDLETPYVWNQHIVCHSCYVEAKKAEREGTEQEVLSLLEKEDYSEAVRVVAQFEAKQVFARGIGIDWKNYDGSWDVESLKVIFKMTPAILRGMEEKRLSQLRPAAGMMLLWGTRTARRWFPKGFETRIHLDSDTVCRMLVSHARSERQLDAMEKLDAGQIAAQVEWSTSSDDGVCQECQALAGRVFTAKEARGMIPHPLCSCENGCRCVLIPHIEVPNLKK
jgi:hypothetical protein